MKAAKGAFYFDHGFVSGKRLYTPLGRDLPAALRQWAELAGESLGVGQVPTWADAARRYRIEVLPTLAPATQASYTFALDALDSVFGPVAIEKITANVASEYYDRRKVKRIDEKTGKPKGGPVTARNEMAVLSTVFNFARQWGYTNAANPRQGKKLPKSKRSVYVSDEQYRAIYDKADEILRDAMDLAYLIGQRPSDVLGIRRADIRDGRLEIQPRKTRRSSGKRISIEIAGELATVLDRIKERPRTITSMLLFQRPNGDAVTLQMIQRRWQDARKAAGIPDGEAQFRDLRAKAATDIDDLAHAQKLLAHTTRSTTEGYVRGRSGEKVRPLNRKVGKA